LAQHTGGAPTVGGIDPRQYSRNSAHPHGRSSRFERVPSRCRMCANTIARHPSQGFSRASEKPFFLARCVTLGSSIVRIIGLIVRRSPVVDRRHGWRACLARIVSLRPPGRCASVIRVGDAQLTVGRRPALVHRRVAAPIIWTGSERDDVQAKGKSRIVSLSAGVPRR
jgi:hypothetical protein